ncbi:MAG: C4-dicarboxylate ABC transporter substrate-binding protein [Flavobacteriales bacterium]|nr:MAG: C4-dicarboxylate ABC transporter substrate-binding protein [Flavobacteriales bacterium]
MKTFLLTAIIFIATSFQLIETPDEYKVRFGSVIPSDSPWEQGVDEYFKVVSEKSSGQIKFRKYLGGQLGGEVEMIKSIAMGALDAGAFSNAAVAEGLSIPELQVFELPFLFDNDAEADAVMDVMFDKFYGILEKKGVILVMWGTNGWRSFGTKGNPVLTPAELKGKKMRSQESDVYISFYKKMGATPNPLATPDVLMALKTGMVDGFDQTPIFAVSTGWVTAINNFTLTKHIYQPGVIVLSKRFYNKLPENMKKAILARDMRKSLQNTSRSLVRKDDEEIKNSIEADFGVNLIELSDAQRDVFKKAVQPVYTEMKDKIGADLIGMVKAEIKKYREQNK